MSLSQAILLCGAMTSTAIQKLIELASVHLPNGILPSGLESFNGIVQHLATEVGVDCNVAYITDLASYVESHGRGTVITPS